MTGEITLRAGAADRRPEGEAAGGARGGIKKVLIPEENAKDLIDLPDGEGRLEIIPVARMEQVLQHALTRQPVPIVWEEISRPAAQGHGRRRAGVVAH
jgi:ATP-dependent Lon protease